MLNTSLHNPNVKDKPPFERFVSINRGIDNGGDLPEELLKVRRPLIYSSVPLLSVLASTEKQRSTGLCVIWAC